MARLVLGIYRDQHYAEDALSHLEERGYDPQDISIVMKDTGRDISHSRGAHIADGTVSGAATGGVLGALAGLLVSTGILPGLGAILIGGPIAAALGLGGVVATAVSGAVTGAVAGGLLGALVSLGVSEDDAYMYETSVREGGILVIVPAQLGEEEEVRALLEDTGADQIRVVKAEEEYYRREDRYQPAFFHDVTEKRRKAARSRRRK